MYYGSNAFPYFSTAKGAAYLPALALHCQTTHFVAVVCFFQIASHYSIRTPKLNLAVKTAKERQLLHFISILDMVLIF